MDFKYGRLSRTVTALSLAVGLSFGGAIAIGAQDTDDVETSRAYLYQGTTDDIDNATMIEEIDDLDEYFSDDDTDDADDVNDDDLNDDDDDLNDDDDMDDVDDDLNEDDDMDDVNDDLNDDDDMDDVNDDLNDDDGMDDVDDVNDDVYEDDSDDDSDDDDGADDFMGGNWMFQMAQDDDEWIVLGNGQEAPAGLLTTEDEIDDDHELTVQTLVDGDYMIVVHADGDNESPVIAAGNIEGNIPDGSVLIQLNEMNASGFEGRAFIEPEDEDDIHELEVTVGVYPVGSVAPIDAVAPTPRG